MEWGTAGLEPQPPASSLWHAFLHRQTDCTGKARGACQAMRWPQMHFLCTSSTGALRDLRAATEAVSRQQLSRLPRSGRARCTK